MHKLYYFVYINACVRERAYYVCVGMCECVYVYVCVYKCVCACVQGSERLGSRDINQKVAGSIRAVHNDIVSLGKALHPTCLGSLYLLKVALDNSAKWLND